VRKSEIHRCCLENIAEKIQQIKLSITELNRSFEDDNKSSAGDKHETSRAMAQLETEKLHAQLHQYEMQFSVLKKITPGISFSTIQVGSIVKTEKGTFYIAVPLGKVNDVTVISAASPLGKEFIGKKAGDEAVFNGIIYRISEID